MTCVASINDYRLRAKARLPHFLFEYYDGGAHDEVTLRRNISDLADIALHQRVSAVSSRSIFQSRCLAKNAPCR